MSADSKPKRYRALRGVNLADGKTEAGEPKDCRVEAGEMIPARFKVPEAWVGRVVEEVSR